MSGFADRVGTMAEVAIEPREILPLAAFGERFREIRRQMELMVPAPPALGEVAAVAGDHNIEDGEPRDGLGMGRSQGVGGRAAPIVADDKEALVSELAVDELPDVVGNRLLVVAGLRPGRVAEAAQIGRDDRIAFRQRRDNVAPFVPGLRPSMQQNDSRSASAHDIVQRHAIQLRVVM